MNQTTGLRSAVPRARGDGSVSIAPTLGAPSPRIRRENDAIVAVAGTRLDARTAAPPRRRAPSYRGVTAPTGRASRSARILRSPGTLRVVMASAVLLLTACVQLSCGVLLFTSATRVARIWLLGLVALGVAYDSLIIGLGPVLGQGPLLHGLSPGLRRSVFRRLAADSYAGWRRPLRRTVRNPQAWPTLAPSSRYCSPITTNPNNHRATVCHTRGRRPSFHRTTRIPNSSFAKLPPNSSVPSTWLANDTASTHGTNAPRNSATPS